MQSVDSSYALAITGAACVCAWYWRARKNANEFSHLALPPGPKPLPLVGNVKDMPTSHEWVTYTKWAKQYGDVMHLSVFGQSIVIISSLEASKALLDGKSAITSDRPRFAMISDLMGWSWAVQFMEMGPRFRKYRKTVHRLLQAQTVKTYWPIIQQGSFSLLRALLNDPEHFRDHVKHHSGGLMMTILYGEQEGEIRDKYVSKADQAVDGLVKAGNVGTFLVDFLPFLKYVPEWMPGAGFQTKARIWRQQAREMIEIPFLRTKQLFDQGMTQPSVMSQLLREQLDSKEGAIDKELIMGAIGVLFVGKMAMNPRAQKRAQEEITSVLGPDKLPQFSDRSMLPYFECVMWETLRWNPGVPLGVPHRSMEDFQYKDYRIPAGATILANQWAILHDEQNYEKPFEFIPERFFDAAKDGKTVLDPREASFGFGRRVCPGKHFADDLLWMLMIHIITSFDITQATDAEGKPIPIAGTYAAGLVTRPEPYICTITPRSDALVQLIQAGSSDHAVIADRHS
ncbi:hypothetical protein SERLA73DRAFT_108873 [Serpula lacrymans var. lacrymans S7.3]|uniref:Cytochrome P450 n=2 Tax=Serpula lacrymans var. lacrymans TaxID=341189 RepID=F8PXB6_SERL3|nr:uncharacterized protein SERLADRAFT_361776 [Serpula lacrymans var. lacrymans S7.9]EGN99391.1 hypothetical protein SERLA73DRAFT_108873 [Serpula lacrymans var. lacrymans S7.3]EGO24952.1 hypothetical protein SERLADRAFT_361776 [Serpula lacrymans var. lacrymans S7.9]